MYLYINQFFIFIISKELFRIKELRSDLIQEWWDSYFVSERLFEYFEEDLVLGLFNGQKD